MFANLTPRLTGAGARSAQGNNGHKNAEGMASVGVRVEPTVIPWCQMQLQAPKTNILTEHWIDELVYPLTLRYPLQYWTKLFVNKSWD